MKTAFLNTLGVLSYVLFNTPFNPDSSFSHEACLKISNQHEMSTVYCAGIVKLAKNGKLDLSSETLNFYNSLLLKKAIDNSNSFSKMNDFLENNLKPCVPYLYIKGHTLSSLYPFSEYRESCDTDILIDEEFEETALKILREHGFLIKNRAAGANHSECYHKDYGVLELHVSLFYEAVQREWFGGFSYKKENLININGSQTLGYDDGFLFLIFHSFKHFVSNVFTLKQFFDILLYLNKYNGLIDKNKIRNTLKELKIENFFATVLTIADKYLNINCSSMYDYEETEFCEEMLEDMQKGGCFGFEKEKHGDMFELYHYEKLKSSKGTDADKNASKWRRKCALKTASFSATNMRRRYKFLAKKPYLLPIAWCNHIVFIIKIALKRPEIVKDCVKYRPKEADDIQKSRLELIKKMGLI